MKLRTAFSLGLLIAYFLPWFNLFFTNLNGFEIPLDITKLTFSGLEDNEGMVIYMIIFSILFFIPPLCLVNIYRTYKEKNEAFIINEFHVGLGSSLIVLLLCRQLSGSFTTFLSFGFYLSFLFSVLGLIKFEKAVEIEYQDRFTHKNQSLLAEAEKLFDMKEKGIISPEIYDVEKEKVYIQITENNTLEKAAHGAAYDRLFNNAGKNKRRKLYIGLAIAALIATLIILVIEMNEKKVNFEDAAKENFFK